MLLRSHMKLKVLFCVVVSIICETHCIMSVNICPGIYTVQFAQFVYNDEKPISQLSSGTLLEVTGVDVVVFVAMVSWRRSTK